MATREELLDALRRADAAGDTAAAAAIAGRIQSLQAAPAPQKPSTFERAGIDNPFVSGLADAGIRAGMGVKQFFGGLSGEDKAVLREMQEEGKADPSGGWRTTGDVAGNIALLAVPGSKASKIAQGTLGAGRLAGLGGAVAGAAVPEAVVSVGDGGDFSDQLLGKAKNAAIAGAGGGVLHGALGAMAQPFLPSVDAVNLINQGVTPTLQQGAGGAGGRFIGDLAAGASRVRERQRGEISDALLRRITDNNVSATGGTGRDYLDAGRGYVEGLYDNVFRGKRFPLSPSVLQRSLAAAQDVNAQGQFQREAKQAGEAVSNIFGPAEMNTVNRNLGYERLRSQYLNPLSQRAYADADPNVGGRILDARRVLTDDLRNQRLTPEELQRLQTADTKNFDVERIREATAGAAADMPGVDINALHKAYSRHSMPSNTTAGELISPAARTIGTASTNPSVVRRVTSPLLMTGIGSMMGASLPMAALGVAGLYGVSGIGQTAKGARALLGQTAIQKKLADYLRRGADASIIPGLINQEYDDAPQ